MFLLFFHYFSVCDAFRLLKITCVCELFFFWRSLRTCNMSFYYCQMQANSYTIYFKIIFLIFCKRAYICRSEYVYKRLYFCTNATLWFHHIFFVLTYSLQCSNEGTRPQLRAGMLQNNMSIYTYIFMYIYEYILCCNVVLLCFSYLYCQCVATLSQIYLSVSYSYIHTYICVCEDVHFTLLALYLLIK